MRKSCHTRVFNELTQVKWMFAFLLFAINIIGEKVELSVPPIWIYIPPDAQLSPPSFGIFKSVCGYGKFVFILVLFM